MTCLMIHSVGTIHEASNLIFNFNSETETSRGNVFHFLYIFFNEVWTIWRCKLYMKVIGLFFTN